MGDWERLAGGLIPCPGVSGDVGGTDDLHIGARALGCAHLAARSCPRRPGNAVGRGSLVFFCLRSNGPGLSPGRKKGGNKLYNNSSELIQDFLKLL